MEVRIPTKSFFSVFVCFVVVVVVVVVVVSVLIIIIFPWFVSLYSHCRPFTSREIIPIKYF